MSSKSTTRTSARSRSKPRGIPKALIDRLWGAVEALPLRIDEDRPAMIAQSVAAIDFAHSAAWTGEPNPSEQANAGERLEIIAEAVRDLRRAYPGRDVTTWEALQELPPTRQDVECEPSGKKDHLALLAEAAAVQERFSDRFMAPTFVVKPGDERAAETRIKRMRAREAPSVAGYLALAVAALGRVDVDELQRVGSGLKVTARKRGRKEVRSRNINLALRLAEIYADCTGKAPTLGIRGGRNQGGPFPRFAQAVFLAYGRPWQIEAAKEAVILWRKKSRDPAISPHEAHRRGRGKQCPL
jgi:hypothetical protein